METAADTERKPRRPLWLFLLLLCLLSWPAWLGSGVLPRAGKGAYDWRWLVAQIGVFGPSLAALFLSCAIRKELRRNNLRILAVLLVPLAASGIFIAAAAPSIVAEFPLLPSIAALIAASLIISRKFRQLSLGLVTERK